MFDEVGRRYDIANTVLSLGMDARWRRKSAARLNVCPGEVIVDLAAGTAVSTEAIKEEGAFPVAVDFSRGMLAAGHMRDVVKVCGDGMNLPFGDDTFDAVTISFGLRNFQSLPAALEEMLRVTKPGGRVVITEFSTPTNRVFAKVYDLYLSLVLTNAATIVSSDPEAYVYLAESIRAWPDQEELAHAMWQAGWIDVGWQNLTGGITAIHSGKKPAA